MVAQAPKKIAINGTITEMRMIGAISFLFLSVAR
jgi:hypothetical protein